MILYVSIGFYSCETSFTFELVDYLKDTDAFWSSIGEQSAIQPVGFRHEHLYVEIEQRLIRSDELPKSKMEMEWIVSGSNIILYDIKSSPI